MTSWTKLALDRFALVAADACVRITEPHTLTLLSGIRFMAARGVALGHDIRVACSPPGLAG